MTIQEYKGHLDHYMSVLEDAGATADEIGKRLAWLLALMLPLRHGTIADAMSGDSRRSSSCLAPQVVSLQFK